MASTSSEDGGVDVLVEVERREDHDPGVGSAGDDSPCRLDAVDVGHADVHQDDVRPERARELNGLRAVLGLTHHLDPLPRVQDHPEAATDERLVVGEDDADAHVRSPSNGRVAKTRKPPSGRGPARSSPP